MEMSGYERMYFMVRRKANDYYLQNIIVFLCRCAWTVLKETYNRDLICRRDIICFLVWLYVVVQKNATVGKRVVLTQL